MVSSRALQLTTSAKTRGCWLAACLDQFPCLPGPWVPLCETDQSQRTVKGGGQVSGVASSGLDSERCPPTARGPGLGGLANLTHQADSSVSVFYQGKHFSLSETSSNVHGVPAPWGLGARGRGELPAIFTLSRHWQWGTGGFTPSVMNPASARLLPGPLQGSQAAPSTAAAQGSQLWPPTGKSHAGFWRRKWQLNPPPWEAHRKPRQGHF